MSKPFIRRFGAAYVSLLALSAGQIPAQGPVVIRDVRVFDGERTTEHRSVLVDSGLADAPGVADVRSAGVGATVPGGHPTQMGGPPFPTLRDASAAPAFVVARIAEGSDYIKIIREDFTGSGRPTLDSATIAAIVREAHAKGKLVVAHAGRRYAGGGFASRDARSGAGISTR